MVVAATLVTEIARQTFPRGTDWVVEIAVIRAGGTTRNIAAERPIGIVRPPTGLAARPEAIRSLIVSLALDNNLADRAATCPAIERALGASETGQAVGQATES